MIVVVLLSYPVQTNEYGKHWVGATGATNNTEMQAMIEAFYWLNSGIECKIYSSSNKVMITVNSIGYPRLRPIRIRPVGRKRIGRKRNWPKANKMSCDFVGLFFPLPLLCLFFFFQF